MASLEICFSKYHSSILDRLHKVRTKLKRTWLIILPDYTNVIKSFKMTLNSKHGTEKLKAKSQRYRNMKN